MIRVSMRAMNRAVLIGIALFALVGCASVDPYSSPPMAQNLQREDDVGYCARLFADIDRRVDTLGVRDAEAHRVDGFPYLRVDRFSVALAQRLKGRRKSRCAPDYSSSTKQRAPRS